MLRALPPVTLPGRRIGAPVRGDFPALSAGSASADLAAGFSLAATGGARIAAAAALAAGFGLSASASVIGAGTSATLAALFSLAATAGARQRGAAALLSGSALAASGAARVAAGAGFSASFTMTAAGDAVIALEPSAQIATYQETIGAPQYDETANLIAWGDSITLNNQAAEMFAGPNGWSFYTTLGYTPADDVIRFTRWPSEVAALIGTVTNNGFGGNTSTQIRTLATANPAPTDGTIVTFSWGTNDGVASVADYETIIGNIDLIEAHGFDKARTIWMPANVQSSVSAFGSASFGMVQYARNKGFQWYNWHDAQLKVAHEANANGDIGGSPGALAASWKEAGGIPAFMSATLTNNYDGVHPGPLFSRALSADLSAFVSAVNGGAPYMRRQELPVDWTVAAGTEIGRLDCVGGVQFAWINNDFGNTGAISIEVAGGEVIVRRGAGAAPSGSWSEYLIEVANASGRHFNRLMLGNEANGYITFDAAYSPLRTYQSGLGDKGTISIVYQMPVSGVGSRAMRIGQVAADLRTNGAWWWKGVTSSNLIVGGGTGLQHHLLTWDEAAGALYNVVGSTFTDQSAIKTAIGSGLNGLWQFFGAVDGTPALVGAHRMRIHHLYVSSTYTPPGSDLSPIWTGAASAITGPASKIAGHNVLYSCRGGPGRFMSTNWGDLGPLMTYPDFSAATARLL